MATGVVDGSLSGNTYIDGVLWDGWKWVDGGTSAVSITYYFSYSLAQGYRQWTEPEKHDLRLALQDWADVSGVTFTEIFSFDPPNFSEWVVTEAQMNGAAPHAYHQTPQTFPSVGYAEGVYNYQVHENANATWTAAERAPGSFYYGVFIHELGHGLGLKHPFNTQGAASLFPGVSSNDGADLGDHGLAHTLFTNMGYAASYTFDANGHIVLDGGFFLEIGGNLELTYGYAATPMAFDIAAIQFLYGANQSYHGGNNVYVLPDANQPGVALWKCIWDAAGTDEIRYNGVRNTIIDLTAATLDNSATGGGVLSYAAFVYGGLTIAHGVVIEKATGGAGKDLITGNAAANALVGNGGADTLTGRLGKDTLNGGPGADIFDFNSPAESRKATADTIIGFNHAQHDRIDLRTIDALPGGADNAFKFIGATGFAAYNATHSGGVVRAAGGLVQVDIGGNNTVDMMIKIPGNAHLAATDFFL